MNWNKLVIETRCEVEERDYEGSMDACMELLEDFLFEIGNHGKSYFAWLMRGGTVCTEKAETPQLAIIKAYLKSKGVALEESND